MAVGWERHFGSRETTTLRINLPESLATRSWNGCRTVISGIIRSFGTKVTFSLAHSGGEYNALVSNGQLWLVK